MDDYCIICEHPAHEHHSLGCHKTSLLKGSCDCTFVERPSLPASATAAHMTLAIQVLAPTEKSCFKSHEELFGWIAGGMEPLIVDGDKVPLQNVITRRYLALAGS